MTHLADIAIEHVYTGRKSTVPLTFRMHPFLNEKLPHAGRFEVLRTLGEGCRKTKRSAHLSLQELAELYARNLHELYRIRLRLRPAECAYPDAPPGKFVPRTAIVSGSDFERRMHAVDIRSEISPGLREQLAHLGV